MANIKDKVQQIRHAIFGKDVRESIASGIESINEEVENTTARQNNVETQFNEQIKNMSLQDPSGAEIVSARIKEDGTIFPNLGTRLNKFDEQINNIHATEKADKTYVVNSLSVLDTEIKALASGSPKAAFATLEDLKKSKPKGDSNIYVITKDGKWYYWNGSAWTAGGAYQAMQLQDDGVLFRNLSDNVLDLLTNKLYKFDEYYKKITIASSGGTVNKDFSYSAKIGTSIDSSYVSFLFTGDLLLYLKDKHPIVTFDINFKTQGNIQTVLDSLNITIKNSQTWNTVSNISSIKQVGNTIKVILRANEICNTSLGMQFVAQFASMSSPADFTVSIDNIKIGELNEDLFHLWNKLYSKQITPQETSFFIASKNLIDKTKVTQGYHVHAGNGNLIANTSFSSSDYIRVNQSDVFTVSGGIAQFAYYDINKSYISGISKANSTDAETYTVPQDVAYVRFSISSLMLDTAQVELGSKVTKYEEYGYKINKDNLPKDIVYINQLREVNIKTKTVKKDGSGDFSKLSDCILSIKDSSYNNQYEILIHEGEYDIMNEIYKNLPTRQGLVIPNYVHLKGIGNKENIIIKGMLPDNADKTSVENISTLNLKYNNNLENLTITAKNLRYAIHDESGNTFKNWERNVINCNIIHFGNQVGYWSTPTAYGEGCSDGSKSYFKNCNFTGYGSTPAYLVHNNKDFKKPSHHEYENCTFYSPKAEGDIIFQSYGSTKNDYILMKGCKISKALVLGTTGNYKGKNDFQIEGYGNSIVPLVITNDITDAKNVFVNFTNETISGVNNSNSIITKGTPCKLDGIGNIKPMTSGDKITTFIGIALADVKSGDKITLKNKGYINIVDLNLTASIGDKIGVINGSLTVVKNDDYIGIVIIDGYMFIK